MTLQGAIGHYRKKLRTAQIKEASTKKLIEKAEWKVRVETYVGIINLLEHVKKTQDYSLQKQVNRTVAFALREVALSVENKTNGVLA